MDLVDVACKLSYAVSGATSFVFNVASAATERQIIRQESLTLDPADLRYEWCELGEEGHRSVRLRTNSPTLTLDYRARVELRPEMEQPPRLEEVEYEALPGEVLPYLNPSRYCESDRLGRFANKEFGHLAPGYSRVEALCDWVNGYVDYVAGSTDASSSACDVLVQRAGVCRDFAHVAIALCRALGIPARYVSGYAAGLQPPDFHGFFESFLGGNWYLFDATRMAPVTGFVRIGVGRDAADASFATITGQAALQSMTVSATRGEGEQPVQTDSVAVSTA
jgi:transglutaminase-like putative cysteine protease